MRPCPFPFLPRSARLAALALTCALAAVAAEPAAAEVYVPRNVAGDPVLPAGLRRVLVLPVHGGVHAPAETAEMLDAVLLTALQGRQRFEVVALARAECRALFDRTDFASTAALPAGFVAGLAARHAADALLFVDVTAYGAYPPQVLGLRLKLVAADGTRLVWACDEVVSAADPAVRRGAREWHRGREQDGRPFDLAPAALQSPRWFAGYVAEAVFATLPRR
jgi:hypothetical protein